MEAVQGDGVTGRDAGSQGPRAGEGVRAVADPKADIIRSVYERWNSGDQAADAFHPDVEWLMPYPDAQGRGKEAMAAAIREYLRAWSSYELIVDEIRELDEGRALVLFTERVTGRHSDMERIGESAALWVFREGLVVKFEGWLHRPDAYAALGIDPD